MGIDLAFWLNGLTSGEETRDLKKLLAITSTLGFKVTKIRKHSDITLKKIILPDGSGSLYRVIDVRGHVEISDDIPLANSYPRPNAGLERRQYLTERQCTRISQIT